MELLAILGSPRLGGNTELLTDIALKKAGHFGLNVKKIVVNDLNIRPCQDCGGCSKTGTCVISDDMVLIYEAMESSDIHVYASPVYFGSVSAQLKAVIDRLQCFWVRKYRLKRTQPKNGRYGGLVLCGALEGDQNFECAAKPIELAFKVQDIALAAELKVSGVEGVYDIEKKPEAIKEAGEFLSRVMRDIK